MYIGAISAWALVTILVALYGFLLRGGWRAVFLAAAIAIGTAFTLTEIVGLPKSIWMEWHIGVKKLDITYTEFKEGEAIYIVAHVPWDDLPRLYVLPWNEQTAAKLHAALEDAEKSGEGVQMEVPFGPFMPAAPGEHPIHKLPIPPAPLKQGQ